MMKLYTSRFIFTLFLASAMGLWSCTEQPEDFKTVLPESLATENSLEQPGQPLSLEGICYHVETESWIRPQKDPYSLANFRQAYDNLLSGKSTQPLTRAQAAEFSGAEQLQATHYCLKIYPRDESEQWKIELMDDVNVAYVPFDYVPLTEQQTQKMAVTRSEAVVFPEHNPHVLIYDNMETVEGPVPAETHILPVLYAVWPCDKPLPEDMDYEMDYEIFRPSYAPQTRGSVSGGDAMAILEREAINLALGISAQTKTTRSTTVTNLRGSYHTYDTFLVKREHLGNLKVRVQLGSRIWDTYTSQVGMFKITDPVPTEAMVFYILQHPRWKITGENSTTPLSVRELQTVADWLTYDPEVGINPTSTYPIDFTVLRAINFFYCIPHEVPAWYYDAGIRIRILNRHSDDGTSAYFTYSSNNQAYISVYLNNLGKDNNIMGSVFHELGHFCQYSERGGFNNYSAVHNLLRESYASYVGWYLAERYYWSRRYEKPYPGFEVSYQGRQDWWKTDRPTLAHYSPLFVDLIDDYNQIVRGNLYNQDPIKNVSHSVILRIAKESTNWTSCKRILQEYVGIYYTSAELNTFTDPYDYWFANN